MNALRKASGPFTVWCLSMDIVISYGGHVIHNNIDNGTTGTRATVLQILVRFRHQTGILLQNLVQFFPMQAVLKCEALCNHVNLLFAFASEVFGPFLDQVFRYQDASCQTAYSVGHFPNWRRIKLSKLFGYFLRKVVDKGLVYVLYFRSICTPSIDG